MTYNEFCSKIACYVNRVGYKVRFFEENGRFIAKCSGVTFFGNPLCSRILIRWGSGHAAFMR